MSSGPRPSKIFYGWWIAGAALLVGLYAGGVVVYGFTAIFEPIVNEMGWSYTQVSLASSLRGMESGITAPLAGFLVDRLGPRKLIFAGSIVAAAGLVLLSQTTSLGMFYVAFGLMAVGTSFCSSTVLVTAVTNWFRKKVGLATGIAVSGFGFSGLIVPLMVKMIDIYQWRTTMMILGFGMLLTVLPLSLIFRHKPEQYGHFPDGETAPPALAASNPRPAPPVRSTKVLLILKDSSFWRIGIAFSFNLLLIQAVITHVMPYLSTIGVDRSISSLIAMAIPLSSIGGRLSFGWLADRFSKRWITAGGFTLTALGLLCFANVSASIWLLVPFLLFFGIGYGGLNPLRASMVHDYFGRGNFGFTFGLVLGVNMIGSVLGPAIAGWAHDHWYYQGIWFVLIALPLISSLIMLTMRSARHEP
ncbi:MAG: MFS transporter [Dehalococcoidales bacterium]|nr:MFS transporter [Dehalococcoidales bacterium]